MRATATRPPTPCGLSLIGSRPRRACSAAAARRRCGTLPCASWRTLCPGVYIVRERRPAALGAPWCAWYLLTHPSPVSPIARDTAMAVCLWLKCTGEQPISCVGQRVHLKRAARGARPGHLDGHKRSGDGLGGAAVGGCVGACHRGSRYVMMIGFTKLSTCCTLFRCRITVCLLGEMRLLRRSNVCVWRRQLLDKRRTVRS
jgi:hypothetical protein